MESSEWNSNHIVFVINLLLDRAFIINYLTGYGGSMRTNQSDRETLLEEIKRHYAEYGLDVTINETLESKGYIYYLDIGRVQVHTHEFVSLELKKKFLAPIEKIWESPEWKRCLDREKKLMEKVVELEKYKTYYEMHKEMINAK